VSGVRTETRSTHVQRLHMRDGSYPGVPITGGKVPITA